ncbi:MAG: DUF1592 domain-containing protein [Myxococcota bacterium]
MTWTPPCRVASAALFGAIVLSACTGEILGPSPGSPGDTTLPPVDGVLPPAGGEDELPPADQFGTGVAWWNAQCANCHGDFSDGSVLSSGDLNGDFRLDAQDALTQHGSELATYIERTMPLADTEACIGPCAELTAAYIESFSVPLTQADCDASAPRGARRFMLLNSREYQRSLEGLLGLEADFGSLIANNDGARGGFRDMLGKRINGVVLDQYIRNAEAIADWAVASGRPFSCSGDCSGRFIDEFLPLAFRGPVSDADRQAYRALFQDFPGQGLQTALTAALSSPHFLYRIETGVDLASARAEGWYDRTDVGPSSGTGGDFELVESIGSHEFQSGNGRREGDAWAFFQNGSVNISFGAAFTDPAVVEVLARGSNHGALWPELTVRIDGLVIDRVEVPHRDMRPYRFEIRGVTGRPTVQLAFENDSGQPPYDEGNDANLYIREASLLRPAAPSAPIPPPADAPPAVSLLEGAQAGDFVLSPFELASALSFMLTGGGPDAQLMVAAEQDRLGTEAQLRAQIERLIDSPEGQAHVGEFFVQWYKLEDVLTVNRPDTPELTAEVRAAMLEELRRHFLYVVYDDVPYSELYDGNYTFLNDTLADYYGVPGNFGSDFKRTEVQGRGGPIASGAFMTVHAHAERSAPILRAVHARQEALCHYIDPPNSPLAGDDIDEQRAMAQALVAEREQEEGALSSRDFYFTYTNGIDACAGCHEKTINPMFGMEDFDHVGRMRPTAGAGSVFETIAGLEKVVSLDGTLFGVDSTADPAFIEFAGAKDLSNKIAETQALDRCLIRKAFRWATGLPLVERDVDAGQREELSTEQRRAYTCLQSELLQAFEGANEDPRMLLIELALGSVLPFRR